MKRALIIVDVLNDFLWENAPLRVPGAMKIFPNIKKGDSARPRAGKSQ
ncbi:MAG: hypothetical protein KAT86_04620 [Candidatus Latescibacteria bacterium]|nr:hypothetical protein [Candidatus Latescibacterota bacterium]